jgi:putative ABC transport system permease protein
MNFRDILRTANANLGKSKLRTFLTISAVFIGCLALMLTTGVGAGLKTYVNDQISAVGAKDALLVRGTTSQGPVSSSDAPKQYDPNKPPVTTTGFTQVILLGPNDLAKITATKGIKSVQPMYNTSAEYVTAPGNANAKKLQVTTSEAVDGFAQPLRAGRRVDNGSRNFQTTLPPTYVSALGFNSDQDALGKTIMIGYKDSQGTIFTQTATIVGVQEKTLINDNSLTLNSAAAIDAHNRATANLPDYQRDRFVNVFAKFDTNLSTQQQTDLKNSLKAQGYTAATLADQLGIINSVITGITTFLNVFAAITLIAATFGIVNTLFMAVQERTREIGLMKALGMRRSRIFALFSLEAILIGFWGAIVALGAANLLGRIGSNLASKTIFKDFDGLHLFSFPAKSMLPIIGLIMLIAFLAATLPARRAAKLDPIDALRYE